ncbi:hypothetical protein C8A01DRAFT_13092 [Parachaetomium inaequale]|uniref:SMODS and SLOG-associating 2TM effector domain-containing protein n=1 Tax=Parachaetomium inaequale TaxID=2588326 RepID=A0AAN6PR01_9PEZI|nr:hypothetical protein C8A01DRAFT_13092 [Parachaetomium inaequale]
MASFVKSLLRLASPKPKVRPDEEQATTADSVFGSSTLQPSHILTTGHRIPADDALALFRLTLGITSAPHLGFHLSAHRPADNVGLYARVVRAEQTAKDSYKVFSLVINACYFLQIIVAASLTALGAANADNKAITAFGAINTVIAGFLTYLKGSGYPARFKYCASEWKKVREFVEHRERDFSLEGCTLDVYQEVDAIRDMYEATKRDIEANNPEGYHSKTGGNNNNNNNLKIRYDGVDKAKADAIAGKLRGLDDKVRKLRGHVGSAANDVESKSDDVAAKLRSLEDTLEKVKTHMGKTSTVHHAIQDSREAAHSTIHHTMQDVEKRAMAELRNLGKAVVRGVEEHRPRPPREVSITVAHRDGDDHANEAEAAVKR